MRKTATALACALIASALATPALSAPTHEDGDGKFTIHGEVRIRAEQQENIADAHDHQSSGELFDDDYVVWPYRVRIGVRGDFTDDVGAYLSFQEAGFFGQTLPNRTLDSAIGQAFPTDRDASIYQGWLELRNIADSNVSLRLGSAEHSVGTELQMGDQDFYAGQVFDGGRALFDFDAWDLDVFYYKVSAIDAGSIIFRADDDIDFFGAIGLVEFGEKRRQEVQPYLLRFVDGNAPNNPKSWTLGGRWSRWVRSNADAEACGLDWNVEAAIQDGEIDPTNDTSFLCPDGDCNHSASILEAWAGWNFVHDGGGRTRVGGGIFISSGDDTGDEDSDGALDDSDVDAWLTLFPDAHSYNRLGDLDLFGQAPSMLASTYSGFSGLNAFGQNLGGISNLTDYNLSVTHIRNDRHKFRLAIHQIELTEGLRRDTFIASPFDLNGDSIANDFRTIRGGDEIGTEVDFKYGYRYSENVYIEGGLAQLSPGDLLDEIVRAFEDRGADDILRAWGMARLRF